MNDDTVRLNKRVADVIGCSRNEAELYIANAFVLVDGVVVEESGARVTRTQTIALAPGAVPAPVDPVTIIFNKPAGVGAELDPAAQEGRGHFLKAHFTNLECVAPLVESASGLVVYTQDFHVKRKLTEESPEQEIIVEVSGRIAGNGLAQLNQGMKVSWQNETRLRFATKVAKPGLLERLCREVGLKVVSQRRIRIGRLPMSSLPAGRWRYLQPFERF